MGIVLSILAIAAIVMIVIAARASEEPAPPSDELPDLPVDEHGWTVGVDIQKVTVIPSVAYAGETIEIEVYIQWPVPNKVPANIRGKVLVDGEELTGEWKITYRNPTLGFTYTPTEPGSYTVKAQDKSASFTVIQDIPATYYSPFGGVRMPICTEVTVPNVEPFEVTGISHPGGDYVMKGVSQFSAALFSLVQAFPIKPVVEHFPEAYPSGWNPPDADVTNWVSHIDGYRITIMAVNYECKEHWDSKDELAKMIATTTGIKWIHVPDEWKLIYGTTCPDCNGTGQIVCTKEIRMWRRCILGEMIKCKVCDGSGKVLRVDLRRGLRDWVKKINYGSAWYANVQERWIVCPYCEQKLKASYDTSRLVLARKLLNHIEGAHPAHPLTMPSTQQQILVSSPSNYFTTWEVP